MINKIQKLQGYRVFRDFRWENLPDFGRYNLIYGWNGAGKTTLSSIFRLIQDGTPPDSGIVELVVGNRVVTGSDFASPSMPPIRVFNRDFVDRNIFEQPNQELPPVYYLGEESAEKQKRISELKSRHFDEAAKLAATGKKQKAAEAELNGYCTTQARSIRNLLLGDSRYNNYEAPKFKILMQRIADASEPPSLLSKAERSRLEHALSGKPLPKLASPSFGDADIGKLMDDVRSELGVTVISSTIEELVDHPEIASWVEQGLPLHSANTTHCHFCQQELDPFRLDSLAAHFNENFKTHQARLDALMVRIESLRHEARAREIPERSALYPHLQVNFDAALAKLSKHSVYVETYLSQLKRALEAKRNEPFVPLSLEKYLSSVDFGSDSGVIKLIEVVFNGMSAFGAISGMEAVQSLAQIVLAHNDFTDNFEKSAASTRTLLEFDEGIKAFPGWSERQEHLQELNTAIEKIQAGLPSIVEEIATLEQDIKQHQKAADELNREMAAYLGRDELRFEAKETGYAIMRGNRPAMHLSEGERTAVAFMYFLKTLQGADFNLSDGIVVIDDPVSSLDANSLYCAFGYMRERARNAKQLFILTHNFGFFRQVKNWFNFAGGLDNRPYRPEKSKETHFYMLGMVLENGQRSAALRTLDPLLHQYESEYHYLFQCVKEGAVAAPPTSLAEVYGLPNIARRLMEAFLSFRVPGKAGNLRQQLESVKGDAASKARILRFLHTHSHMEQIGEPEHDLSVLSETPAILAEVLALIMENDRSHYDAMVEACGG